MKELKVHKLPKMTKRKFVKRILRKHGFSERSIRGIVNEVAKEKGRMSYAAAADCTFSTVSYISHVIETMQCAPGEVSSCFVSVNGANGGANENSR